MVCCQKQEFFQTEKAQQKNLTEDWWRGESREEKLAKQVATDRP